MPRPEKVRIVDELADRLERASMAVLTDYRGLTVAEMQALRARLRQHGVELKVAKNTLTRFAAQRTGRPSLLPMLEGPTAIAFSYGEPAELARALGDYLRTARTPLKVKGAIIGDRAIGADDLPRLAELPPRAQLLAQVIGGMQAPIAGLVTVLNGTLASLVGVLEARRRQLEEQGSAASAG